MGLGHGHVWMMPTSRLIFYKLIPAIILSSSNLLSLYRQRNCKLGPLLYLYDVEWSDETDFPTYLREQLLSIVIRRRVNRRHSIIFQQFVFRITQQ